MEQIKWQFDKLYILYGACNLVFGVIFGFNK